MITFLLSVRKRFRVVFLFLYVICIIALSLLPPNDLPKVKLFNGFDKVVHFLMYFPFSALLCWVFSAELKSSRFVAVIGLAVFWGIFMEFLQLEMRMGRSFSWYDELANFSGIIVGTLCYWLLTRKFANPEEKY